MTTIHQIDSILITILMDSTDFQLTNSYHAIKPQLIKDEKFILPPPPEAEHGFSALIQISELIKTEARVIKTIRTRNFSSIQV
jgi:hypothetical protein